MSTRLVAVFLLLFINSIYGAIFSLDGTWRFYSPENNFSGQAIVPGDIYSDLYRNAHIANSLYGENDQNQAWVGRTRWVYQKEFDVPENVFKVNRIVGLCKSFRAKRLS